MVEKYPDATISDETYFELESIFKKHDSRGLPIFSQEPWADLNSKYHKHTIREALQIYILENESPFPYKRIQKEEVVDLFNKLRRSDYKSYIREAKLKKVEEVELKAFYKYPEENYSFENDGCLLIQSGHQYNRGSDYFQQENRYDCGTWSIPSPIDSWRTWKGLKRILGPVWRMDKNKLDEAKYIAGIRLGLYNATQFKPPVARAMYNLFKARTVMDMSCGWGDRLFGFYTSTAEEYYGCDPNEATYKQYMEQCRVYESILDGNCKITEYKDHFVCEGAKKVTIWNLPAEDLDYSQIPEIDLMFSSPPYFATEKYAESGNKEQQSWFRYDGHKAWQEDFLYNVLGKVQSRLSPNGTMAVNIIDGSVKGARQYICEPMIDHMKTQGIDYKGQIGMTLAQRPNTVLQRYITRKDGETPEEHTARVAILEKKVVSEIPYIEPIYVFSNGDYKLDGSMLNEHMDVDDLFE